MKATIITNEYPPHVYGGAGVHVKFLTRELAKTMQVEVRCFGEQQVAGGNLTVRGYQAWERMWEGNERRFNSTLGTFSTDLSMVRDRIDSDIIHAHTWYANLAGYMGKMLYDVPLICTTHSLEPLRPWKEEQLGRSFHLSTWAEKLALEASDRVVAVSQGAREDVLKLFDVDPEKVRVIHNGIDLDLYRPIEAEATRKAFDIDGDYVLFVGRTSRQKGMTYLIDAMKHVDPGVRCVCCTSAPDTKEIEEEIAAKIAAEPRVIWINSLLREEQYVELYSHARVFACPSVYEPFGIINLEAMACKTPIVASRVGGILETVVDGETGLLVEPQNPRAIADGINTLLRDRKMAAEFGENGRRRVERYFSWTSIAAKVAELYREVIEEHQGALEPLEPRSEASVNRDRHVVIESVSPAIGCGRYPVKRVVGQLCGVEATIFRDGPDVLRAVVRWHLKGQRGASEAPLALANRGLDLWRGAFPLEVNGRYLFTVEAWTDVFATWLDELKRKVQGGRTDLVSELTEGRVLVEAALARARLPADKALLGHVAERLGALRTAPAAALELALRPEVEEAMLRLQERADAVALEPSLEVIADRPRAVFGSWYEIFARSQGTVPGRSATFREAERRLPEIARMGFDVLYLTPFHPVGRAHRKGRNNSLSAGPNDPGSPWAIGNEQGGHDAIEPGLGTLADFDHFVATARDLGLELAIDFAVQCSPDHPWVTQHPEWFYKRPDGTIRYAENPPKKYEDIYPLNFDSPARDALFAEIRRIMEHWIQHGVTIFRVDNPHTKPIAFWRWLIEDIQAQHPEILFLAEAFTRPPVMNMLAKIGFSQSYTYFTWRNAKAELTEYLTELTRSEIAEYYRPNFFANTPDILHEFLQRGGRPAFLIRLVLAGTLGPTYGIYSGFELCENVPVKPGTEEYLDSEKYQIKVRDWDAPGNIKALVGRVNAIRRENPALQELTDLRFYPSSSDQILFYGKATRDGGNVILVAVNLDPTRPQEAMVDVPLHALGVPDGGRFQVEDLLTGARYDWGARNYVRLAPELPAHILRVTVRR